jgi:hypothetical protein
MVVSAGFIPTRRFDDGSRDQTRLIDFGLAGGGKAIFFGKQSGATI